LASDVPYLPLRIAVMAAALCLSAFFSGSETALFSFQPDELEQRRGAPGADGLIAALRSRPKKLLITILFGNMVVNVVFYSVSFLLWLDLGPHLGPGGVAALSVASLLCVLLFGEVLPKNVAVSFYHPLGRLVAWPVTVIQKVLLPVVWPLERVADAVAALTGGGRHTVHADELRLLISLGAREGYLDPGLGQMLVDVIGLGEVCISELMVPRVDMPAFNLRGPEVDLLAMFRHERADVLPVYDGNPEDMLGVVHMKDVLFRQANASVAEVVCRIPHLPATATVEQALLQCRRARQQAAFVVDEHGTVVGFVTVEALLEEIAGEIADEHEPDQPPPVELLDDGLCRVQGALSLRDWARVAGVKVPSLGVDTVGGLVMALLDRVPVEGDVVRWDTAELTVERVEERRVVSVVVRPCPKGRVGEGADA
jgi:putative hemolysin